MLQHPAALNDKSRLTLKPIPPKGSIKDKNLPRIHNVGYPGGWGDPRQYDAAISSPASLIATVGDTVLRKSAVAIKKIRLAITILLFGDGGKCTGSDSGVTMGFWSSLLDLASACMYMGFIFNF